MTRRVVTAVVALVMVVAACGGDDGDSERASPQPSVPTSAPPATTATTASTAPSTSTGGRVTACYSAPRAGAGGGVGFRDATEERGLVEPLTGMYSHAVAPGDVNGDGWTDLFVGHFADRPADVYRERGATGPAPDRLLLGGPEGFHVDETFPEMRGRTSGAAFADFDGDGDLDLALSRNVSDNTQVGRTPSVVLRNDGGRFVEARELDDRRGGRSLGVFDYDADGRLDLFLVEDRFAVGSSALYRNTGDLEFADVTEDVGLPAGVDGLGVAATDLDGDRRPDLFVAGSNRLFVNVDGERFREVDNDVFRWPTFGDEDDVAGVATGDFDGDGRVDLVVGQHYNSTLDGDRSVSVRLYANEGDAVGQPRFRDVTDAAGLVGLPTKAPHVEVVDFDADGRLDILTTASADEGRKPAVFRGLGVESGVPRFATPDGLGSDQYWVTGATDDFDRDGRLDVFLVDYEPARPSRLLAGDTDAGHWLAVGVGGSGTRGIGSRVEVFPAGALGDDAQRMGERVITAATGFAAGSAPVARFGLGDATAVDVRVHPPGGEPIDLPELDADQLVLVDAGAGCSG